MYDRKAILAAYESGLTLREVAAKFGCSMQWVHRVVRQMGGQMRPPYIIPKRRRRGAR